MPPDLAHGLQELESAGPAIGGLFRHLLSPTPIEETTRLVLRHALQLTGSPTGMVAYADPGTDRLVYVTDRDTGDLPPTLPGREPVWTTIMKAGAPVVRNTPQRAAARWGVPAGHPEIQRYVGVPSLIGGKPVGLLLLSNAPRDYTDEDEQVLTLLAEFYALVVQKHSAEQAVTFLAREQAATRTADLHAVTAALSCALTPADVARVLLAETASLVGAAAGLVAQVNDDGSTLVVIDSAGYPADVAANLEEVQRTFPLGMAAPLADAARRGEPIYLSSAAERTCRYPDAMPTEFEAVVVLPLQVAGRLIGALALSFDSIREFSPDEHALMSAVAQQCAQSLERARLYVESLRHAELLEASVVERTVQLEVANESLKRELLELERTEEALRDSEQRYRTLAESAQDSIFVVGGDLRYRYINPFGAALLGTVPEQVVGQHISRYMPAEAASLLTARLQDAFASSRPTALEAQIDFAGRDVFLGTRLCPLFAADGGVEAVLGIARDITERKRVEDELFRSNQMLQRVLDNIPQRVFWKSVDGVFQGASRSLLQDAGLTDPRQIIGKNDSDMPWRQYADIFREVDLAVMQSNSPRLDCVEPQVGPDGPLWVNTNRVPLHDREGRVVGVLGTYEDITARKLQEEALRESELRFRLSVETMLDGFSILAPIRDEAGHIVDFRYEYVNSAGCRLNECPVNELVGHSLFSVFPQLRGSPTFQGYVHLIETGEPLTREGVVDPGYTRLDGRPLAYDLRAVKLGDRMVSIWRDVTDRERATEERAALIAELENKNAELERFTYTVSHDLKSPLITIRGFLGFLEQDIAAGDGERVHSDVQRVANAASKMQQLLDELLALSRIGRVANTPELVPARALAQEVVNLVAGRLAAGGVRVEIADDLPVLFGDRLRLREALLNLVDNAAKFMGNRTDPLIEIAGRPDATDSIVCVRDNGIGIAPAYHDKVFGLFDKLDQRTDGTGVGLAIVKRIVEVHGGRVWVESDGPGQGSTFCLGLPPSERSPLNRNV